MRPARFHHALAFPFRLFQLEVTSDCGPPYLDVSLWPLRTTRRSRLLHWGQAIPRHLQSSGAMGRPEIGKLGKQIAVVPYLVLRHLPICEDGQKSITGVIGECPPIVRKA